MLQYNIGLDSVEYDKYFMMYRQRSDMIAFKVKSQAVNIDKFSIPMSFLTWRYNLIIVF